MSEPKKVALTSLGLSKKEKKAKKTTTTYRFALKLTESNERACPEFVYTELTSGVHDKEKGASNGTDDPFGEEDDSKLRALARKYEKKYGGNKRRPCGRFEDYVDLGAGYDENDPFIDNSDAYDEIVPEDVTTVHGGFYINSGALEFQQVENASLVEEEVQRVKKRRRRVVESDDEEGVENAVPPTAKKTKQVPEDKSRKIKDAGMIKKKAMLDLVKRKKAFTVKDLLRQKREKGHPEPSKACVPDEKTTTATAASICDAIESVVNAALASEEAGEASGSDTASNDTEETPPGEQTAEAAVPEDLSDVLASLKNAAKESGEGKCRFFTSDINDLLLCVERKTRTLPCAQKQAVFAHLAEYLPCTKDTLLKRAKKLAVEREEEKMAEPTHKLRDVVQREVQTQLSQMKGETAANAKFIWSDEASKLFLAVVNIKAKCYKLSKSRKESAEEYLKSFLEKELVPFWPPGWVTTSGLYEQSESAHSSVTSKFRRQLKKWDPVPETVKLETAKLEVLTPRSSPVNVAQSDVKMELPTSSISPTTEKAVPSAVTAVRSVRPPVSTPPAPLRSDSPSVIKLETSPVKPPTPILPCLDADYLKEITVTPIAADSRSTSVNDSPPKPRAPDHRPAFDLTKSVSSLLNNSMLSLTVRESKPKEPSPRPTSQTAKRHTGRHVSANEMIDHIICSNLAGFPSGQITDYSTKTEPKRPAKPPVDPEKDVQQEVSRVVSQIVELSNKSNRSSPARSAPYAFLDKMPAVSVSVIDKPSSQISKSPICVQSPKSSPSSHTLKSSPSTQPLRSSPITSSSSYTNREESKKRTSPLVSSTSLPSMRAASSPYLAPMAHSTASGHNLPSGVYAFPEAFRKHLQDTVGHKSLSDAYGPNDAARLSMLGLTRLGMPNFQTGSSFHSHPQATTPVTDIHPFTIESITSNYSGHSSNAERTGSAERKAHLHKPHSLQYQ